MLIRLIRSELIKLRTTQVWFWLLLGCVAMSALFVIGPLASDDIHNGTDAYGMFAGSAFAYILIYVLGALGITTETRYQTITPTVLATPSRGVIVLGKLITYALVGAIYAAICVGIQCAIAFPWLSAKGIDVSFGGDHIGRVILGVFGVMALFGIVGVGVGALLRNQIVAVTVGVVFLLIAQQLLIIIPGVKHAYPYTPGAAVTAILLSPTDDRNITGDIDFVSAGTGVVLLLLYAIVPAIFGAAYSLRRDIT